MTKEQLDWSDAQWAKRRAEEWESIKASFDNERN